MSAWAGYLGPDNSDQLKGLLGDQARTTVGSGYGLGIRLDGPEPGKFATAPGGRVVVSVGSDADAFSSATVDPSGPTVFLARDPFGFHGLYTTQVKGTRWFSSDLRVLNRVSGVSSKIDPQAMHGYLCFSYVPSPLTMTAGITTLAAGDHVTITGAVSLCENHAGWHEAERLDLSEESAVTELRERLLRAVAKQVEGESEVGVFLSGGIDSSLIAAMLRELGLKVRLFTLDFGPPFNSEIPYARQVATSLGQPLCVVPASPKQVKSALVPTAAALAQPFGDGVTVPLYLLGQAAAKRVGLVFNGEGGDQLFGGWANKPIIAAELYGSPNYDREEAYLQTYHRFYGLTARLYTPFAEAEVGMVDVGAWVRPALNAEGFFSLLHRLRAANLWLKGAQNILPRATQLAAAHGLRMRAPFFDRKLTEWTFGLPPEWFLQGACEKYLLKRAAEPYLPSEVVWREKRGMGVPTTQWCLGPLKGEVRRRLSTRRLKRDDWFDPSAISDLRSGKEPGEYRPRRVGEKIWALLMLHTWLDTHEGLDQWPASHRAGG